MEEEVTNGEGKRGKPVKEHKGHHFFCFIIRILIIFTIFVLLVRYLDQTFIHKQTREKTSIISTSTLTNVLQISDLSTYKAVYNGVAEVKNSKDTKTLYHVAYQAEVDVGLDMANIKVNVDDENKKVTVTLPEIKITDVNVKMESLEYIFEDNSANTSSVSNEAYSACIADAREETESNDKIYSLAKENAIKMVKAILEPIILQEKDVYTLEID